MKKIVEDCTVEDYKKENNKLKQNCYKLGSTMRGALRELRAANATIDEQGTTIAKLHAELTELQSKNNALKAELSKLTTEIDILKDKNCGLRYNLEKINRATKNQTTRENG